MKDRTHKIKTLQDILKAVNSENVENFLRDFGKFLSIWVGTKAMIEAINPESLEMTRNSLTFDWIDDGKNDAKVTIQVQER